MRQFAAAVCVLLCGLAPPHAAADSANRNIILVTLDGVRTQELFAGMDAQIAATDADSGAEDIEVTRKRYWRETAQQRREALMPFFWKALVPAGMVLGNAAARQPRSLCETRCGFRIRATPRS